MLWDINLRSLNNYFTQSRIIVFPVEKEKFSINLTGLLFLETFN